MCIWANTCWNGTAKTRAASGCTGGTRVILTRRRGVELTGASDELMAYNSIEHVGDATQAIQDHVRVCTPIHTTSKCAHITGYMDVRIACDDGSNARAVCPATYVLRAASDLRSSSLIYIYIYIYIYITINDHSTYTVIYMVDDDTRISTTMRTCWYNPRATR